jgi:hypothetical protein
LNQTALLKAEPLLQLIDVPTDAGACSVESGPIMLQLFCSFGVSVAGRHEAVET